MSIQTENMKEIFGKIDDLKAVFKVGERILPILTSLIDFMGEIIPLLENINTSISDSTNQMPKVSNQINNVTSATELATTEILDLVDEISNELNDIEQAITKILELNQTRDDKFNEIIKHVEKNDKVIELLNEYKTISTYDDTFNIVREVLAKISNDAFKITMSLQVQDITSQQLSAVNHLIESVNTRLTGLVKEIDSSDLKKEFGSMKWEDSESTHFDGNASYIDREHKQQEVDQIISDQKQVASQEEIDKLFS
ncbi:MAG: protein phosphatase CheZ [Bacteroidetes bacterium]|nr:protein phosphatase CheZ [Bacteroidota bacterium]